MKWNLKSLALLVLVLMLVPIAASADVAAWNVDPAHSNMGFSIRHFFSQVPGRFGDFTGTIQFDPEKPGTSSIEITVQAASINTDNNDRDNHLRSPDFFDVEKFPTLQFKSTKVEAADKNKMEITGDLTIHGVTKTITFPAEFFGSMDTPMGTRAGFHAQFTIDRQDFGVSWNRALDQGGAILGDDVKIEIGIEAVKKTETKAK